MMKRASGLDVETILVLSTEHLAPLTANAIDRHFELEGKPEYTDRVPPWVANMTMYRHGDYGWLVHTGGDLAKNFDFIEGAPDSVIAAVAIAEVNGCNWLLYDRDGPTIDALPLFEWH